jgi:hypothetical protein
MLRFSNSYVWGRNDHSFFEMFDVSKFPTLKTITIPDKALWPKTQ